MSRKLVAQQLTLTLKMTTAQFVETSVTVNNNSPIQDYVHPDDQTQPTFEMTPGFKPFTALLLVVVFIFMSIKIYCVILILLLQGQFSHFGLLSYNVTP